MRLTHTECLLCARHRANGLTSPASSPPPRNLTRRNGQSSHFTSGLTEHSAKWESSLTNGRAETKTSYFGAYFLNHCVLAPASLTSFGHLVNEALINLINGGHFIFLNEQKTAFQVTVYPSVLEFGSWPGSRRPGVLHSANTGSFIQIRPSGSDPAASVLNTGDAERRDMGSALRKSPAQGLEQTRGCITTTQHGRCYGRCRCRVLWAPEPKRQWSVVVRWLWGL